MDISLNLLGYVGQEPEAKILENDTFVLNFSLATSTGWGDKKVTTWWRVSMFGERAEKLSPHISKGTPLLLKNCELRLDPATGAFRTFTAKDGTVKVAMEVTVRDVIFAGKNPGNGNDSADN